MSVLVAHQFLIVLTIIVAIMWGATQWVAHVLAYAPTRHGEGVGRIGPREQRRDALIG